MFDLIPWRKRDTQTAPEQSAMSLRQEMDEAFDRFFGSLARPGELWPGKFAPAIDISENDDEFVVKAELPGIAAKDLDVNLTGNLLTIKGEKKHEKEEKGENFHRVERSYGSFSRTVEIPGDVREDAVTAQYKDGVLNLKLPKTEESKSKRKKLKIDVK